MICTNAATRVMYTMAQAGTLPSALRTIHPVHKTPSVAIHVEQIFQIVSFLAVEHPTDFSVWQHAIVPAIGTLLLLPVLFVTVWPIPAYPLNVPPYVFIVLMIVGFVVMKVIEAQRPEALAQGSSMQISTVAVEAEEPQVG